MTSFFNVELAFPSQHRLRENSVLRHGADGSVGPLVRIRRKREYYTPEEYYECVLDALVNEDTRWLDVGCGRDLLPMNTALATRLAGRCRHLAGIDPSPNVLDNVFLDEKHQAGVEDFHSGEPFDLISFRMVIEHIENPTACVQALHRLSRPGSTIVLYTPHRYSLLSMAATIVPNRAHHTFKRLLWNTEERDTFPTFYRMNTREALQAVFEPAGFGIAGCWSLDDATVLHALGRLARLELLTWSSMRLLRIPYPERNLLAIFVRN